MNLLELNQVKIDFVDDQQQYLDLIKEVFSKKNIKISTTKDYKKVTTKAISGLTDIFLSDLDLRRILDENDEEKDGIDILFKIRKQNSTIFLALLTAYEKNISADKKAKLKRKSIYILSKDDDYDALINNLEDRYREFQQKAFTALKYKNAFDALQEKALTHLNNLSSKELLITVPGFEEKISVKELIEEVQEGSSDIAIAYIYDWFENLNFIETLRKKLKDA